MSWLAWLYDSVSSCSVICYILCMAFLLPNKRDYIGYWSHLRLLWLPISDFNAIVLYCSVTFWCLVSPAFVHLIVDVKRNDIIFLICLTFPPCMCCPANLPIVDMQELVDIDVFLDAKRVIDSLQNNEVAPALAWCAENKSRLKKSKVCLTFFCLIIDLIRSAYYWC